MLGKAEHIFTEGVLMGMLFCTENTAKNIVFYTFFALADVLGCALRPSAGLLVLLGNPHRRPAQSQQSNEEVWRHKPQK